MKKLLLVCVATAALFTVDSSASTPRLFNYQGRLTNSAGVPVPDGSYKVIFTIYNDAIAGSALWAEKANVETVNGLFTVTLGATEKLPNSAVSDSVRYLGIAVDPDPEIVPRQQLTSALFAINGGGWIDAGNIVYTANTSANVGIGTATPATRLDIAGGNWNVMSSEGDFRIGDPSSRFKIGVATGGYGRGHCRLYAAGGFNTLTLGNDSGDVFNVNGSNIGFGTLYPSSFLGGRTLDVVGSSTNGATVALKSGSNDWEIHAGPLSNGRSALRMTQSLANPDPIILTDATGDSSVILRHDAISSEEMLNEPGIAVNIGTNVSIPIVPYTDLTTVTITIPTAGYVVLEGRFTGFISGTTGRNFVYVQIDDAAGGLPVVPYYTFFGSDAPPNISTIAYPVAVSRTFFEAPGTYTFHLKAAQQGSNSPGSTASAMYPSLRAAFYPTSYGTVMTMASSSEAGTFQNASAIQMSDPLVKGSSQTVYKVDLRELELRTARTQAEAERLQKMLDEARIRDAEQVTGAK